MPAEISQILKLPFIQPSQAQKHVTHNEALRVLDVLVQLVVSSRTDATPPATPPDGRRHIVPAGGTGDWADQDGNLAVFWDGGWTFLAPLAGWQAYVKDEDIHVTFQSGSWNPVVGTPEYQDLDQVGVNTRADTANRLAVSSDNTLLTHAGDDHRLKVNKASADDTASLLFQSGFTGLAEMGAIGAESFSVRVSDNGSTWRTALSVDGASAKVAMPQGLEISGALTGTGVVGTVSESGDVSTGAILEQGETPDGYYTRWADGTQICWTNDFEIDANNQNLVDAPWSLPRPMVGPYTVNCTLPYFISNWSEASERNNVSAIVGAAANSTTARVGYYPINTPVTVTVSKCCVVAFGRWY